MRPLLAIAVLAACAGTPPPAAAPARPLEATRRPPPSAEEVKRMSHAVLDAYDRGDLPALEAAFAPEFLRFEGGKPSDRAAELDRVRKRPARAMVIAKRTWANEHTQVRPDDALYFGLATELTSGNEARGGYRYVGWYALHWVRRGEAWQLRLWTWQRGGENALREHWNDVFRYGKGFEHRPNRLLVETIEGVKPGDALDVAMGQGRNALHLASKGWRVTGVDLSDEGIRLAREAAAQRGLSLQTVNTNIDSYDFGTARWDLVTMIYAGDDVKWIEKIKPSLRPGGLFIVEYFGTDPAMGKGGFARGQLAKLFADGYDILRDDFVEDVPDWAMDRAPLVRFVAKKRP